MSNGWLLYSGFHSYLLKGGVKRGGCHPTREAKKPKTHCVKRDKSTKAHLDDVTGLQQRLFAYLSHNANIIIF